MSRCVRMYMPFFCWSVLHIVATDMKIATGCSKENKRNFIPIEMGNQLGENCTVPHL